MGTSAGQNKDHQLNAQLSKTWRRPSRCASSGCLEARLVGDEVTVRNSRDPGGARVRYDRDEWSTFLAAVKAGEFDIE